MKALTVGSQVKQCLASLKNVQAGLETFAIQSNDAKAERDFYAAASSIEQIIDDLNKRIGQLEREEPQYKGF